MVPEDSYSVAFEISEYIKENSFNIIITGRESTDYNGGAVPGMIAELTNLPLDTGIPTGTNDPIKFSQFYGKRAK